MSREEEIKQEAERIAFQNATTDLRVHIMNLKAEALSARNEVRDLEFGLEEERKARIGAEKAWKNLAGENKVLREELAAARSREAAPVANVTAEDFLIKENAALREAGWDLAEAAMRVGRESDGVHRLMLATAKWVETIANEGGRDRQEG